MGKQTLEFRRSLKIHNEVKLLRTLHVRQRRDLQFKVKGKLLDIIERHREIIRAMLSKIGAEGRENENQRQRNQLEARSKSVMKYQLYGVEHRSLQLVRGMRNEGKSHVISDYSRYKQSLNSDRLNGIMVLKGYIIFLYLIYASL